MKIIVARYNENIEWVKQFPNVIVYNKGQTLNKEYNEIDMPNIGREGHTYYKYMYDNYDNLDDYTIFLQGNPFDHSPNIIHNIWKCLTSPDLNIDFEYLVKQVEFTNLSGCKWHAGLPFIPVYEKLFGEKKEKMPLLWGSGAQFIVSKKSIHSRPKDFYMKIIKMLEYTKDPIEGYVIERIHKLILTGPEPVYYKVPDYDHIPNLNISQILRKERNFWPHS